MKFITMKFIIKSPFVSFFVTSLLPFIHSFKLENTWEKTSSLPPHLFSLSPVLLSFILFVHSFIFSFLMWFHLRCISNCFSYLELTLNNISDSWIHSQKPTVKAAVRSSWSIILLPPKCIPGIIIKGGHVWIWELDCEESWAPKNWCFWTVVLEKTLESPLDCRRSNRSILKEISPGCSLEGLMLKLKLQYFGHLMRRVDSLEKTLMLGGIGGRRRRGQQRVRWLDGITDSMDMSLWWTGRSGVLRFMALQRVGHDWVTELN